MRRHHRVSVTRRLIWRGRHCYRDGQSFMLVWDFPEDMDNIEHHWVPGWASGIHPPVKGKRANHDWSK